MITFLPAHRSLRIASLAALTGFGACALFSTGCATRGYEKAASTSDAVTAASTQAELTLRQIDDATTALHRVVDNPPVDLKTPLEQYRSQIAALERSVAQLRVQTDDMSQQGRNYFDTWDQRLSQMQNEDIRARSAARQQEVASRFSDIQRRYQDARRALDVLMPNLRDIQSALGIDLTPQGVQGVSPVVAQTDRNAAAAREALSHLAEGLRTLGTTLRPATTPATTSP